MKTKNTGYSFQSSASSPEMEDWAKVSILKDGVSIVFGKGKEAHDFLRKALKALSKPGLWEHSFNTKGLCIKCGMSQGYAKGFKRPCEK
jgi:hypothetical protein